MQINIETAAELVVDVLKAGLVPFVVGSPGVGKSDLARQIARQHNLKLLDVRLSQMDPADLLGFPFKEGKKASYIPMNTFPIEGDPVPEGYNGWLLLLDEFNSAPISVQAAAYRIVLDKQVGVHSLHKQVGIIAAGNLMTDKAIVNRLSTAMQSRLIHFEIEVDHKAWIKWADQNDIDHRIKSFINFKPDALHSFDPNHQDMNYPCPRTWYFLSKLVSNSDQLEASKIPLFAGTIGEGMAREFYSFSKIYGDLPTIKDILANPGGITISSEPSIQYALTGLISHNITENNADKLMIFMKRLTIDFQVICLRSALARDDRIKQTQAFKDWISLNARELM